ncbi:MAG TPA: hypothetical protein DEQ14_10955 [Treponema sp.]|nr:hypothetical protein [Treponema sp.]
MTAAFKFVCCVNKINCPHVIITVYNAVNDSDTLLQPAFENLHRAEFGIVHAYSNIFGGHGECPRPRGVENRSKGNASSIRCGLCHTANFVSGFWSRLNSDSLIGRDSAYIIHSRNYNIRAFIGSIDGNRVSARRRIKRNGNRYIIAIYGKDGGLRVTVHNITDSRGRSGDNKAVFLNIETNRRSRRNSNIGCVKNIPLNSAGLFYFQIPGFEFQ